MWSSKNTGNTLTNQFLKYYLFSCGIIYANSVFLNQHIWKYDNYNFGQCFMFSSLILEIPAWIWNQDFFQGAKLHLQRGCLGKALHLWATWRNLREPQECLGLPTLPYFEPCFHIFPIRYGTTNLLSCIWVSSLPMLRIIPTLAQGDKYFSKPSKPCHVGIHRIVPTEFSQVSTHVQGFQSFFRFFASFCIGQISHQQHKG